MGVPLLLVGIVGVAIWGSALDIKSRSWPSVKGRVVFSQVVSERVRNRRGPDTVHRRPVVEYDYVVGGVSYRSRSIHASFGAKSPAAR